MRYQLQMLEIERYDKPNNSGINRKIKNITKKIIGYLYSEFPQQVGEIIKYNEKGSTEVKNYIITKIIHIVKQGYETECILEIKTYDNVKLYSYGSSTWEEFIPLVVDVGKRDILPENYLYHGSLIAGLKYIEPHIKFHKESFVYASTHASLALISSAYGEYCNDKYINMGIINGIPYISEKYPNILKVAFSGKSRSICTVGSDDFEIIDFWPDYELVNRTYVEVIKEEIIPDILEELLRYEKEKKLFIKRFTKKKNIKVTEDDINRFKL
ncbi:MAG: hypothetical protein M0P49_03630 [Bacilli bacterium]|nr:hypothetical protein [Bacilli bacterium]